MLFVLMKVMNLCSFEIHVNLFLVTYESTVIPNKAIANDIPERNEDIEANLLLCVRAALTNTKASVGVSTLTCCYKTSILLPHAIIILISCNG